MKRLTYIYLLIPLYTALSFIGTMQRVLGTYGALALGGVLCLAVWAIVWLRLYRTGKGRPEFAVLSVLPTLSYLILNAVGEETSAAFSTPAWQNLYFFEWVASAIVLILSLRRDKCDGEPRKWTQDATLHLSVIFVILYTVWTWSTTAARLFTINN